MEVDGYRQLFGDNILQNIMFSVQLLKLMFLLFIKFQSN